LDGMLACSVIPGGFLVRNVARLGALENTLVPEAGRKGGAGARGLELVRFLRRPPKYENCGQLQDPHHPQAGLRTIIKDRQYYYP